MPSSPSSRRGWDDNLRKAAAVLPSCAGLLGAAGVLVSAAAAHSGGASIATTAGLFLLLHAAAVLGLAALADRTTRIRYAVAGWLLTIGTVLFAGDLALAGLASLRPLPAAAPMGGLLLVAGWLAVPVVAIVVRLVGARRQ